MGEPIAPEKSSDDIEYIVAKKVLDTIIDTLLSVALKAHSIPTPIGSVVKSYYLEEGKHFLDLLITTKTYDPYWSDMSKLERYE